MSNQSLFNGQKTWDQILREMSGTSGNPSAQTNNLGDLSDRTAQSSADPFLQGMYEVFGQGNASPAAKSTGDDFLDGFYGIESTGTSPARPSTTSTGTSSMEDLSLIHI